ncbi:putative restriction endonuclease [Fadolivirus algeromassiliense]|jgi:very-short-patch-repair endonuclease|uniref:Restriction endonuclease n=1 Tax=Fadolivirus FV1/VV64 TaxID=3070911 RepID=A0A7D3QXW9_9VIRU|nr:putative restriction endonuclease [Fadolivirus algeromassiliense]QKF94780.1 putative restriction endonuclease [Fadolivirus FV1/VV64]
MSAKHNKIIPFEKSFAAHPKSNEWSDKNQLKPINVCSWTQKKYIFCCSICHHEYNTSPNYISAGRGNCHYCTNQKLCGDLNCEECKNKSFASHPYSKYWSNKNELIPINVFKKSNKKYFFKCEKCCHDYEVILANITQNNQECPFCKNVALCGDNKCQICTEKSFASNPKSIEWSSKNKTLPINVFKSSGNKFLFDCVECHHTYTSSPHYLSQGKDCPYCANKSLCDNNDCTLCFEKSFASDPNSKLWSNKNSVLPRNIFKGSHKIYYFNCLKCNHDYDTMVYSIVDGQGCPYCANKRLCDDNNCKLCEEKSFLSNSKAKYWSKDNNVLPRYVFKKSHDKYIFDCPDCNETYIARLADISRGNWCICTKNKTETKLYKFLILNYNLTIIRQKTFDWCKNKKCLPYDFFIEDYNLIIELDGMQHFKQIPYWNSLLEKVCDTDKYKMKLANDNGYSIIRIFQEDVWYDKNSWQNKLKNSIKKYDKINNIFIGNIYNNSHFIK